MKRYMKEHGHAFFVLVLCSIVFLCVFWLYGLPVEAVVYPALLCIGILSLDGIVYTFKENKKHTQLNELKSMPDDILERLSDFTYRNDEDYRELIGILLAQKQTAVNGYEQRITDSRDYYTTWVHQIKTPIAAMRLKLEGVDTKEARALLEELFRIEQYVEMVLTYQRLTSEATDYVIREYELDTIVKACVRRFASQFIGKGLTLELDVAPEKIITDEKWLGFVIEQLLSNAVKYTSKGGVAICYCDGVLKIRDTGIGIAKDDLPRIFEKGYTGKNGRTQTRASGLGLYLCKQICNRLENEIYAESVAGEGTTVSIKLNRPDRKYE